MTEQREVSEEEIVDALVEKWKIPREEARRLLEAQRHA